MKTQLIVLTSFLLFLVGCGSIEESDASKKYQQKVSEDISTDEVSEESTDIEEDSEIEDQASSSTEICSVDFSAYINNPSGTATNVRKSPGGEVVVQLTNAVDHEIHLIAKEDKWYMLDKVEPFDYDSDGDPISYDIPGGNAWIHQSVLEIGTRNYGNQEMKIFAQPFADAEVLNTVTVELYGTPIDACGEYIKISAKNGDRVIEGWIKKEWVCSNPVTTCS